MHLLLTLEAKPINSREDQLKQCNQVTKLPELSSNTIKNSVHILSSLKALKSSRLVYTFMAFRLYFELKAQTLVVVLFDLVEISCV